MGLLPESTAKETDLADKVDSMKETGKEIFQSTSFHIVRICGLTRPRGYEELMQAEALIGTGVLLAVIMVATIFYCCWQSRRPLASTTADTQAISQDEESDDGGGKAGRGRDRHGKTTG